MTAPMVRKAEGIRLNVDVEMQKVLLAVNIGQGKSALDIATETEPFKYMGIYMAIKRVEQSLSEFVRTGLVEESSESSGKRYSLSLRGEELAFAVPKLPKEFSVMIYPDEMRIVAPRFKSDQEDKIQLLEGGQILRTPPLDFLLTIRRKTKIQHTVEHGAYN